MVAMTEGPLIKGAVIGPAQAFTVHITITPKGGAGKTEVATVLEAALTATGHSPVLIDVDDGNRGLTRRIGKEHVVALNWASGPEDAPTWVRRHAAGDTPMIFDLGAGLMSADLPILDFLGSVWRLLYNKGARIVFHCVVSTNAPTNRFIGQILENYGRIAEVVIVCNNQDGSASFPADIASRENHRLKLDHLYPGLQAVRLLRKVPLSALIAEPMQRYTIATKMIAARVYRFARQLADASLLDPSCLAKLEAAAVGVPPLHYTLAHLADATDDRIERNARLSRAHRRLVAAELSPSGLLSAAEDYRLAHAAWVERSSTI
jgi:hypothetical protein